MQVNSGFSKIITDVSGSEQLNEDSWQIRKHEFLARIITQPKIVRHFWPNVAEDADYEKQPFIIYGVFQVEVLRG